MLCGGVAINAQRSKFHSGEMLISHFNEKLKAHLTPEILRPLVYHLFCRKKPRHAYSIYLESLFDESGYFFQENAMKI
jgi:hypothetical protein